MARLGRDIEQGKSFLFPWFGDVRKLLPRLLLHVAPTFNRTFSVRRPRHQQDGFDRLAIIVQIRLAFANALPFGDPEPFLQLLIHPFTRDLDRFGTIPLLDVRTQRDHLPIDIRVVALDDEEMRHALAGNRFNFSFPPILDLPVHLSYFIRAVMPERRHHDVLTSGKMLLGQLRERLGDFTESIPIAFTLPWRRDRRVKRVDKRMHVRAAQIMLLVPGRRRQHDVREQSGARHTEVQADEEISLALRRHIVSVHVLRSPGLGWVG
ncbi:hypothetical protein D3C81_994650 [compost metagenome]